MGAQLKRNIPLLQIFSFLRFFAFWQPIDQLFLYSIGGDETVMGIGVAIWMGSQFIFEVPSGYMSDRFGKKRVFYIAQASRILGFLLIAIPQQVTSYYLGLFFFGVTMAFISGSDKAMLHDSLRELKREGEYRKLSGMMNGLAGVGMTCAGLLAVLVAQLGYRYNYLLSIIPQLLLVLVVILMVEPRPHLRESLHNPAKDIRVALKSVTSTRALQLLLLLAGTVELVKRINMDFGQAFLFATLGGAALVPLIWGLGTASRAMSNFMAHRIEGHTWKLVGLTFAAFLAMAFGPREFVPLLYIVLFLPINIVILQAEELVQRVAPDHLRATTLSGMNMFINLAETAPIIFLGWFISNQGAVAGFRWSSTLLAAVIVIVYAIALIRRRQRQSQEVVI